MFEEFNFDESLNNLKQLYLHNTLGKNGELHKFVSLMKYVPEHFVIALDGRWGSGKTVFVKQAKMIIDALNENKKYNQKNIVNTTGLEKELCDKVDKLDDVFYEEVRKSLASEQSLKDYGNSATVYFDAWENDNANDPIQSLALSMIDEFATDKFESLKPLVNGILKELEHISPIAPIVCGFNGIRMSENYDVLEEARRIKKLKNQVNDFLDKCIGSNEKIILFIDELDRCRPEYAVILLERLKHYFSHKKVVFVFSVNAEALVNVLRCSYGEGFDADSYLDKFFDLRIGLSQCETCKYLEYLGIIDQSKGFFLYNVLIDVIKYYKLELRAVRKFIGMLSIALNKVKEYSDWTSGYEDNLCCVLTHFLIACRMCECETFNKLVNGNGEVEFVERVQGISELKRLVLQYCSVRDDNKGAECSVEKKLSDIYCCMFVEESMNKIGNIRFSPNLRMRLLNIVNCFSNLSIV